jgi:hypothetical protein
MGCCYSKLRDLYRTNEYIIEEFEMSLPLSCIESLKFQRCLYRFSRNQTINPGQFEYIAKASRLNLEKFGDFYLKFSAENIYNFKLLNCLGIQIGLGSLEDKVKLLFDSYAELSPAALNQEEVKAMITDLATVSLCIIPNYVSEIKPSNQILEKYAVKLKLTSKACIMYYTSIFMDEQVSLSFHTFANRFFYYELTKLLNASEMRKSALKIYSSVKKSAEGALIVVNDSGFNDVYRDKTISSDASKTTSS